MKDFSAKVIAVGKPTVTVPEIIRVACPFCHEVLASVDAQINLSTLPSRFHPLFIQALQNMPSSELVGEHPLLNGSFHDCPQKRARQLQQQKKKSRVVYSRPEAGTKNIFHWFIGRVASRKALPENK